MISALFPEGVSELDDDSLARLYSRPERSEPWLRVNFVSSVDGAATVDGVSGGLGGEADRRVFDILRELTDVVLVGAGTVRNEGYGPMRLEPAAVARRTELGLARHPVFAIVSNRLDLDPASRIFVDAPVRPIILTTQASPPDRRTALAEVAEVIVAGQSELDPRALVAALVERGLTQQHCEGGPALFGALLAAGVVDELCLTISPLLAGGAAGRITVGDLVEPSRLILGHALASEGTLLLRYEVVTGR